MNWERTLLRLRRIFLGLGGVLGLAGGLLLGASILISTTGPGAGEISAGQAADCASEGDCGPVRFAVDKTAPVATTAAATSPGDPSPSPPQTAEPGRAATGDAIKIPSPTLTPPRRMVPPTPGRSTPTLTPAATVSAEMAAADSYTSTAQVHGHSEMSPAQAGCPAAPAASFDLVPVLAPFADHPDAAHPDLNVALRGFQLVPETPGLVKFEGPTAPDPPQLAGLFQPNRGPLIKNAYRVSDWNWDPGRCGGLGRGCPGSLIDDWKVTMVGLATRPGEAISAPERAASIYPGGYRALVLYATETQLTLGYTRQDTVSAGYAVHLQGLCVDSNLLALYRSQIDPNGWRATGYLPALRNDQVIGLAQGDELRVAIRDKGSFMDPRSGKDWWRGY